MCAICACVLSGVYSSSWLQLGCCPVGVVGRGEDRGMESILLHVRGIGEVRDPFRGGQPRSAK